MVNPIFIIGVPRSGTTLLRVILDSHSRIAAAPETPWILGGYGPVSIRELICGLIEHKTGPVKNLAGISSELINSATIEFLNKIFYAYLQAKQKDFIVLKTPDDIQFLDFLIKLFPDSTYIHVFRDGRDVACSTVNNKETFFDEMLCEYGELNHENAIARWYDWETKARKIFKTNHNISQISIQYEHLVTNPKEVIMKICQVLDVGFEMTMLDYHLYAHDYPEWEAGSTDVKRKDGIDQNSIGKWKAEINPDKLKAIEVKYGNSLKELGYEISTDLNIIEDNALLKYADDSNLSIESNTNGFFYRLKSFVIKYNKLIKNR